MAVITPLVESSIFHDWRKACGIPADCTRMVIDMDLCDVVKVYYQCPCGPGACLADHQVLSLDPPTTSLNIAVEIKDRIGAVSGLPQPGEPQ